jgi:hypothetical protein
MTMRLILEVMGRAVGFELSMLHVKMVSPEEAQEEPDEFKHAPMDPHGTLSAHIERRSDLEDAYGSGVAKEKPAFGFAVNLHEQNQAAGGI